MAGFEKLVIYKKSIEGVKIIYKLTLKPPINKNYSLVDQIRRASASVTANIAEGYGRNTKKDRSQFLTYALGSSNEVIAFLDIIAEIYKNTDVRKSKEFYDHLGKQIYLFRKNLIE